MVRTTRERAICRLHASVISRPMNEPIDLDAYFQRIGWTGETRPVLATLAGLLRAHMRHIPFENLDVLLGNGVRLELDALQDKLVRARRGGYCFEHATLFAAVLEALGFAPVRHSARVILFAPPSEAARTHMFLTVTLAEGTFVVDPGFGSLAPDTPVALDAGASATVRGATHWMAREGATWVLRARIDGNVANGWVTTLEADNAADFVVANHYTATHPASAFRNRLMLRALTGGGSISVMNRDVTVREGASIRIRELANRAELRALLARHFGFDLPEVESLRVPAVDGWR